EIDGPQGRAFAVLVVRKGTEQIVWSRERRPDPHAGERHAFLVGDDLVESGLEAGEIGDDRLPDGLSAQGPEAERLATRCHGAEIDHPVTLESAELEIVEEDYLHDPFRLPLLRRPP